MKLGRQTKIVLIGVISFIISVLCFTVAVYMGELNLLSSLLAILGLISTWILVSSFVIYDKQFYESFLNFLESKNRKD